MKEHVAWELSIKSLAPTLPKEGRKAKNFLELELARGKEGERVSIITGRRGVGNAGNQ